MTFPSFTDIATRRYLPSLSDAFAADDKAAHLDFDEERRPRLDLVDGDRRTIDDPRRAFVDNVLCTLSECVGPLDIARIHGRLIPRTGTGGTLNTKTLIPQCRALQSALTLLPAVDGHAVDLTLAFQTNTDPRGGPSVEIATHIAIPDTGAPLSTSASNMVDQVRTPIEGIASRMAAKSLGAWLHACGDVSMTLHGRITSPAFTAGKGVPNPAPRYH